MKLPPAKCPVTDISARQYVEIDKRIDARLSPEPSRPRPPAGVPRLRSGETLIIGVAVGALFTGLGAIVANGGRSPTTVPTVITIWLILAVAGLAIAFVRSHRGHVAGADLVVGGQVNGDGLVDGST